MRREKKLVKPDSERRVEKPKNNFGKYLAAGTLMLTIALSPKARAQEIKWTQCECGEPKLIDCGDALYTGSKKVYDPAKDEYTCYCAECPDSGTKEEITPAPSQP